MNHSAQKAIQELERLGDNSLYSMPKIEWWLLKYQELYNFTKETWSCPKCPKTLGCICRNKENEYLFIEQFETFEELSQYHRKEPFFKELLEIYETIKSDQVTLKKFIQGHEELCINEFEGLYFDFLSDNGKEEPLIGNSIYFKNFEILIQYEDFKHTSTFLYIYNYWFYEKKILPKSIARLDAEIEKMIMESQTDK